MNTVATTVTTLRTSFAQHRSERRDRLRLERELASYDTPSDRVELAAILERHTAEEIAPIEAILSRQAALGRRTAA
jgi:hypothetical protein